MARSILLCDERPPAAFALAPQLPAQQASRPRGAAPSATESASSSSNPAADAAIWRPPLMRLQPSSELADRVRQAATQQPPPPERAALARRHLALGAGSGLLALAMFLWAGGPRPVDRPLGLMLGTALGLALITAAAAWTALGPSPSTLGKPRAWLAASAAATPLALLGWKLLWSAQYPGAFDPSPTRPGLRCLALTLAIGLSPLVAVLLAKRDTEPRRPALLGLAAGTIAGAIAACLTDLWCPVAHLAHLLLGHTLPLALLGVLGAWLGRRMLALGADAL